MGYLELGPLSDTIKSFPFYRRYVDDIFIVLDNHSDIISILDTYNLAHPSIQFTSELENIGTFNFMDVQLWKNPTAQSDVPFIGSPRGLGTRHTLAISCLCIETKFGQNSH